MRVWALWFPAFCFPFGLEVEAVPMKVKSVLVLLACTAAEDLVGAGKDEHGCIATAGYKWCESLQKVSRRRLLPVGADI
jgi:hypothetical protein